MRKDAEHLVRLQQLKLLRFEKHLREIAPMVLATGLSAAGIASLQSQLATLDGAKFVFKELKIGASVGEIIETAEKDLEQRIERLGLTAKVDSRRSDMLAIMESVDSAHQAAQESAHRNKIRLIGEKMREKNVEGGRPKVSNVTWFANNFVEGGRPKVSENARWLRSKFGIV